VSIQVAHLQTLSGHRAAIFALHSVHDTVLSGCGDGLVACWPLDTVIPASGPGQAQASAVALARIPANVFSLCWLADSGQLLVGGMHGGAFLLGWDDPGWPDRRPGEGPLGSGQALPAGKVLRTLSNPNTPVFAMLHLAAEQEVWLACGDGILRIYETRTWALLRELAVSRERLRSLSPEPSGDRIAVCASDGCVYLLNRKSKEVQQVLEGHEQSVFCAAWTPAWTVESGRLVTGSRDARLRIWQGGPLLALDEVIPAHLFTINALAMDPGGRWLASASRDKTVKLWSTRDFRLLKVLERPRFEGHARSVNALIWHKGLLVSASDDRTVKIWEVHEGPSNQPLTE